MLLNELFNTQVPLRKVVDEDDVTYVGRLSDGTVLKIMFQYTLDGCYTLSFARGKRTDFADADFDKNGMGNEQEVFSAVIQATQEFLNQYQPESLDFTAAKPEGDSRINSRTNLYGAVVSRFKHPNYFVKKIKYGINDEYQIIRKDSQAAKRADDFSHAFNDDFEDVPV
jgi:hypothetical protein